MEDEAFAPGIIVRGLIVINPQMVSREINKRPRDTITWSCNKRILDHFRGNLSGLIPIEINFDRDNPSRIHQPEIIFLLSLSLSRLSARD